MAEGILSELGLGRPSLHLELAKAGHARVNFHPSRPPELFLGEDGDGETAPLALSFWPSAVPPSLEVEVAGYEVLRWGFRGAKPTLRLLEREEVRRALQAFPGLRPLYPLFFPPGLALGWSLKDLEEALKRGLRGKGPKARGGPWIPVATGEWDSPWISSPLLEALSRGEDRILLPLGPLKLELLVTPWGREVVLRPKALREGERVFPLRAYPFHAEEVAQGKEALLARSLRVSRESLEEALRWNPDPLLKEVTLSLLGEG